MRFTFSSNKIIVVKATIPFRFDATAFSLSVALVGEGRLPTNRTEQTAAVLCCLRERNGIVFCDLFGMFIFCPLCTTFLAIPGETVITFD